MVQSFSPNDKCVLIFSDIDPEATKFVSDKVNKLTFKKNTRIFSEEKDFTSIYVIQSGYVKICASDKIGHDVFLAVNGPGSTLGEFSIYNHNKYPVSAITITETTVCSLESREFIYLFNKYKSFSEKTSEHLFKRVKTLNARLAQLNASTVEERLELLFRDLANEFGIKNNANQIIIPFTLKRIDLAQFSNTTPETTTRIMKKWEKEDKLYTEHDNFILTNKFLSH